MNHLINFFDIEKIANSNPEPNLVRFAIKHSYILDALRINAPIVVTREPLTEFIILNKNFAYGMDNIKNLTEYKFNKITNYLVVPMKKTFIGSANTPKQIKFVRDLTESQIEVMKLIKNYQVSGEFIEITKEEAEEKLKNYV